MLETALVVGLAFGLGVGFLYGLGTGLVVGFVAGLVVGPGTGLVVRRLDREGQRKNETAWSSYMLTRGWLAFNHHLPWRLMSFLADAHSRGVLRQAGAVYQFRHIELQHRLANRDLN